MCSVSHIHSVPLLEKRWWDISTDRRLGNRTCRSPISHSIQITRRVDLCTYFNFFLIIHFISEFCSHASLAVTPHPVVCLRLIKDMNMTWRIKENTYSRTDRQSTGVKMNCNWSHWIRRKRRHRRWKIIGKLKRERDGPIGIRFTHSCRIECAVLLTSCRTADETCSIFISWLRTHSPLSHWFCYGCYRHIVITPSSSSSYVYRASLAPAAVAGRARSMRTHIKVAIALIRTHKRLLRHLHCHSTEQNCRIFTRTRRQFVRTFLFVCFLLLLCAFFPLSCIEIRRWWAIIIDWMKCTHLIES